MHKITRARLIIVSTTCKRPLGYITIKAIVRLLIFVNFCVNFFVIFFVGFNNEATSSIIGITTHWVTFLIRHILHQKWPFWHWCMGNADAFGKTMQIRHKRHSSKSVIGSNVGCSCRGLMGSGIGGVSDGVPSCHSYCNILIINRAAPEHLMT
jgi:hypothetical protein